MKLYPTHNLEHYNTQFVGGIQETILSNGQSLYHPWWTTGGGNEYRTDFIDYIISTGKSYQHAYEWCCGHGVIGFEILTQGISQTIAFSDYYDLAVNSCLDNSNRLERSNDVSGYITGTLSVIPDTEKWDLIVGNPPNNPSDNIRTAEGIKAGHSQDMIDLGLRIVIDPDWQAHRDFFSHIEKHLLPNADLFLSVHQNYIPIIDEMAKENTSLVYQGFKDITGDPSLKIAHWRVL